MKLNYKSVPGFTLIEVVISLAILTILIIGFLSLFTTSLIGIYGAGDKGVAYSDAQSDIEARLGTREALAADDLELFFNGKKYSIPGGLVESTQTEGQRSSTLETFIPMVPTISINPLNIHEGYQEPVTIKVTAINTKFNSSNSTVGIYDKTGEKEILPAPNLTVNGIGTEATFTLPPNLTNAAGYYIVRITTPTISGGVDLSRAKFIVEQPNIITVGSNAFYVSENGAYWYDRQTSTLDTFPTFSSLHDICFGNNRYIAVGSAGQVLRSTDQSQWSKSTISINNLYGIAWSGVLNKYYTIGSNGTMMSSANGSTWTNVSLSTSVDLYGIAITSGGYITAVGTEGMIITSDQGISWTYHAITTEDNIRLNDVATNYDEVTNTGLFIAVGDSGTIVTSLDGGSSWSVSDSESLAGLSNINLNSICFKNDLFVAVGDSGTIAVYNTLNDSWTIHNEGDEELFGVTYAAGMFVAVGANNTILTSDDNAVSWAQYAGTVSGNFNAVGGR